MGGEVPLESARDQLINEIMRLSFAAQRLKINLGYSKTPATPDAIEKLNHLSTELLISVAKSFKLTIADLEDEFLVYGRVLTDNEHFFTIQLQVMLERLGPRGTREIVTEVLGKSISMVERLNQIEDEFHRPYLRLVLDDLRRD